MNCKTINRPKFKLINYLTTKNISHNKASNNSFNFSNYFSKVLQSISKKIFSESKYVYHKNTCSFNEHRDNYDITDTTELRLIASRRTFM